MIYGLLIDICLLIDKVIYGINVLLFELFIAVSQSQFPESVFQNFLKNIYVIIGIFMIFKVSFSLIQMLANPDLISDKEKGMGKIAMRIVIAFGLIILIPSIFTMAFNLQSTIVRENIVGKLILGNTTSDNAQAIKDQGRNISMQVFKSMITPGKDSSGNDLSSEIATACNNALKDGSYQTIDSLENVQVNGQTVDCFKETENGVNVYNYKFLVSSLATGMVAWLMVGFCIDIGVRLVKLTFLQLIAPVCIVTYVSGGKDNSFGKWLKMTISAYVSVFIKLVVIFFMIYMAGQVSEHIAELGLENVPLGQVAVILGLLVFAKNAPKLIGDLFGVKMDEESGFKGIAKTALLGGAALAAGGTLAGASNLAKGFGDTVKNVKDAGGLSGKAGWSALKSGTLSTLGSTIAGTTAGAFYGAKNGFGKNATLGGSVNKALMTSRTNRDDRADRSKVYGGGAQAFWYSNVADRIRGFAGIDTKAKKIVNQHKNIGAGLSRAKNNVLAAQNQIAQYGVVDMDAVNSYSYNAFDKTWSRFDGSNWIEMKNGDGSNMTLTDMIASEESRMGSAFTDDEKMYLQYTLQDSQLEKQIIDNNKAQGKAETQQKKMEGTNGGNK